MKHTLLIGPVIVTRYLGPTYSKGSRAIATHKRESGQRAWSKSVSWDPALDSEANHKRAAQALLDSWPYENDLQIVGRGHDADHYYWLTVGAWQLEQKA